MGIVNCSDYLVFDSSRFARVINKSTLTANIPALVNRTQTKPLRKIP